MEVNREPKQLIIRSHNLKLVVVGATVDEPSCNSSHQSGLARSSSLAIPARSGSVISIDRPHWTGNIHVLNLPLFNIQIRIRRPSSPRSISHCIIILSNLNVVASLHSHDVHTPYCFQTPQAGPGPERREVWLNNIAQYTLHILGVVKEVQLSNSLSP
ncbi:hypothetical protein ASPVEDRAFT_255384 [Aspergillus versicolor CBS 583.65]|uniref:Uncharacterized protein n=1 Tax=Aspergillus versicolor CBS 583.65 TaxID=1036611 RepID=A0A1L9P5P8_ASPVE|nr:uncharacterized protein ASPVEDRAFT_255384 [Aspergillus versicolor CBS 583.65]OJI96829.1 hypothetical protein ASPVEDRAFT_255384 [Aspergillus versicolor CBS 583.65]